MASSALLLSPPERVAGNERQLLIRALEKTTGNQTQAARLLRITRDTLRYKMKKYNLR
jgi:DNA-binding protein Fis